jgi:hypothetical protein
MVGAERECRDHLEFDTTGAERVEQFGGELAEVLLKAGALYRARANGCDRVKWTLSACKRRSENPSVKRPDCPVAPE